MITAMSLLCRHIFADDLAKRTYGRKEGIISSAEISSVKVICDIRSIIQMDEQKGGKKKKHTEFIFVSPQEQTSSRTTREQGRISNACRMNK